MGPALAAAGEEEDDGGLDAEGLVSVLTRLGLEAPLVSVLHLLQRMMGRWGGREGGQSEEEEEEAEVVPAWCWVVGWLVGWWCPSAGGGMGQGRSHVTTAELQVRRPQDDACPPARPPARRFP